jgi:hypothetical protein
MAFARSLQSGEQLANVFECRTCAVVYTVADASHSRG